MCAQDAAGFAGVAALAIAELSTSETFAARTSCLLCSGLFSCGHAGFEHDDDAWLQRRCPAGRIMCAQDAAGFAGVAALAIAELIKHDRDICRTHELFALPRLVFVRPCGVCTR
jgi:hypothetical protein